MSHVGILDKQHKEQMDMRKSVMENLTYEQLESVRIYCSAAEAINVILNDVEYSNLKLPWSAIEKDVVAEQVKRTIDTGFKPSTAAIDRVKRGE